MLTVEPTTEMIAEWKRVFEAHHSAMKPNRKDGAEVDRYFRGKYAHQVFDDAAFKELVSFNITENEFSRNKLPEGVCPSIQSYKIGNALVGIDLITGEFFVVSENIEDVVPIHDDLFAFRGLDEEDLKNFFLVAEYVELTQN